LEDRNRSPEEEHEYRVLTWSSDFADADRAAELAATLDRPFAINYQANKALGRETKAWSEADLAARCRLLDIPSLILHGERDPRPPWAVESLCEALPRARLTVLAGVGHVPWLEARRLFDARLRSFLASVQ
jgi:proline iminopeptidase